MQRSIKVGAMRFCGLLRDTSLPLIAAIFLAIVGGRVAGPSELFGAEDEQPPRKWALLIGIDKYTNLPALKFAGVDQRDLAAQLVKVGFAAERVIVMRDDKRKGLSPSKANIEKQLDLLLDPKQGLVEKGDLVIVGFAGHGVSIKGKSYLCPAESNDDEPSSTMIPLDNIYQRLELSRAALKLLVVDVSRGDPTQPTVGKTMSHGFFTSLRKPPPGLMVLSSCGEGQKALVDTTLGHSVFMHFLLDGFSGKAAREDGEITLTRLYFHTSLQTRKYVAKKFKAFQMAALEGRTEGNFELCRIDPEAQPEPTTSPAEETKPDQDPAKLIANSIGMKLALIPAGEFTMGSPETEFGYGRKHENREEEHRVVISRPFYMGIHEVTQAQFQAMMGKNPSGFSTIGQRKDLVKGMNTARFPVENITLHETQEFCRRLSEAEGKHYRLPTEAEWEYACRAGTSSPYSFGDTCNGTEANCNGNRPYGTKTKGSFLDRTARVGSYRPNAFGLYDMHGNVWERCADWYDSSYYTTSPVEDPEGPATGSYNTSRGGGWFNDPAGCRAAASYGFVPSHRDFDVGFRVCRDPDPQ